jgi:hypothetical protein
VHRVHQGLRGEVDGGGPAADEGFTDAGVGGGGSGLVDPAVEGGGLSCGLGIGAGGGSTIDGFEPCLGTGFTAGPVELTGTFGRIAVSRNVGAKGVV